MSFDPTTLLDDPKPQGERLQKFLSAAGVASRRHAEQLIKTGRVTVNDEPAQLGMRVTSDDVVRVNGLVVGPQAPRTIMLNKPVGVVTTADDPHGRPTVVSLVPDDVRLYPVGRLGLDTSGLLLMTNHGDLAHRLMHPSFGVEKIYSVLVEGLVSTSTAALLRSGIELEDGPTHPAKCRIIQAVTDRTLLEIAIHEGRNRQVRRMCDAVGHPVISLVRTGYGPLQLGDTKVGSWRELSDTEMRRLLKSAGLNRPRKERSEVASSDTVDAEDPAQVDGATDD